MENLITLTERENREKESLKEQIERQSLFLFFSIIFHCILIVEFGNRLQNENFEESDLLQNKGSRIESLQQELRKQVEDMQEIEDLLSERQNVIEI